MQLKSSIGACITEELTVFTCDYEIITLKSGMYCLVVTAFPMQAYWLFFFVHGALYDYVNYKKHTLVL